MTLSSKIVSAGNTLVAAIEASHDYPASNEVENVTHLAARTWRSIVDESGNATLEEKAAMLVTLQSLHFLTSKLGAARNRLLSPAAFSWWINDITLRCLRCVQSNMANFSSVCLPGAAAALGDTWRLREGVELEYLHSKHHHQTKVVVGDGATSVVYAATLGGAERVAAKVLTIDDPDHADVAFTVEAAALTLLRHPGVALFYGGDRAASTLVTALGASTLADALGEIELGSEASALSPLRVRVRILAELAAAVVYMHTADPPIVSGDISVKNVILDAELHAFFIDFAFAKVQTSRVFGGAVDVVAPFGCTEETAAPETLRDGVAGIGAGGPPCDIYAFGVLAYEVLAGRAPWGDAVDWIAAVAHNPNIADHFRLAPRPAEGLSEALCDMVVQCTQWEPSQRPRAFEVLAILMAASDS